MKSVLAAFLLALSFVSTQANADAIAPNQVIVEQKENNIFNSIREITGQSPKQGMKGEYVMANAVVSCIKNSICYVTIESEATRQPDSSAKPSSGKPAAKAKK